jgi:RNA polymerase subunit RPABC4/transcription elongation factor Spt4
MTSGPGSAPAPSPALVAALAELDRLAAARPELQELCPRVACLLRATFGTPGSVRPGLDPGSDETAFLVDRVREGWQHAAPAVRVLSPSIEPETLAARVRAIDACAGDDQPVAWLRSVMDADASRTVALASSLLTQGAEPIRAELRDQASESEADYTLSVLRLGLLGELGDWSGRICARLAEDDWPLDGCPVCGGEPLLAELRGLEQRRFLRCGRCAGGWPAARGRCPYCGVTDACLLRFLQAEEDGARCRLVLCDACGGRLKVVTTLGPASPPGLVVAELATIHLDFLADPEEQ